MTTEIFQSSVQDHETGTDLTYSYFINEQGQPRTDETLIFLDWRANAAAYRGHASWLSALVECSQQGPFPAAEEALLTATELGARVPKRPEQLRNVDYTYVANHIQALLDKAVELDTWANHHAQ